MKFKSVKFINATLPPNVHEMIDASIILMLANYADIVDVYIQNERCDNINKIVSEHGNNSNIFYHKTNNLFVRCAKNDMIAAIIEACIILFGKKNGCLYVVNYINMFSCHINNLICKITGKSCAFCIHSEIEVIDPQHRINGYWDYLIKRFFLKTSLGTNVRLFVLSKHIFDNISSIINDSRSHYFFYTDHPYFSSSMSYDVEIPHHKKIRIGIIGSVTDSPQRGFNNIVTFAQSLKQYPSIEIQIISKISSVLLSKLPSNVIVKGQPGMFLPRYLYDSYVSQLDCIYIPYPEDQFRYTASGAILDAIAQQKPILMHKTEYFVYLAEKFGSFGYFIGMDFADTYQCIMRLVNDRNIMVSQRNFLNCISPQNIQAQFIQSLSDSFENSCI